MRERTTYKLISQRIRQFRLAPRKICLPGKHLDSLVDLALLQAQLGECGHRGLALGVDPERLVAASLRRTDVLFPLIQSETFVDQWKNILRSPVGRGCVTISIRNDRGLKEYELELLQLNRPLKFLYCIFESLLIQQQFSANSIRSVPLIIYMGYQ